MREGENSAQPCGCDEGAKHLCYHHTQVQQVLNAMREEEDKKWTTGEVERAILNKARATAIVAEGPHRATTLPEDPKERKKFPIATGVLFYFPDAIAAVARVSWEGNQQHNPGQPLHWARGKSMDQEDTLLRHLMQSGSVDTDGQRHSAKMAWRALAILQLEIEADNAKGGK